VNSRAITLRSKGGYWYRWKARPEAQKTISRFCPSISSAQNFGQVRFFEVFEDQMMERGGLDLPIFQLSEIIK
jgi:hypothetical protein